MCNESLIVPFIGTPNFVQTDGAAVFTIGRTKRRQAITILLSVFYGSVRTINLNPSIRNMDCLYRKEQSIPLKVSSRMLLRSINRNLSLVNGRGRKEGSMNNKDIRARIEEIGIIPAIRVSNLADARFAAESVLLGGIPIVEISMVVPQGIHLISDIVKQSPDVTVGAGGILDKQTARQCIEAGAQFLTTDALDVEVVEFAAKQGITIFPGALTPTEILAAWKAGADFVKIMPCAQIGGADYIRALKAPFPQIPLIAAGGVNQRTAAGFISAGAVALGVGNELVPRESIARRESGRIGELCRRFLNSVTTARRENAERFMPAPAQIELAQSDSSLVIQGDYI